MIASAEGGHDISFLGLFAYVGLVVVILFALMALAKSAFGKERVFKNFWAQRFEQVYLFIDNMCVGIIGEHGRKYVPFILTFWLVIFVSNVVALFMPFGPTADLSWNLGMALIAIGYVQFEGMKANGVLGHFSHFAGPKLPIALIPITGMIFVIEIISEIMKNVSLSLRLFGNIHGGHEAVEAMNKLGEGIYVPVGAFLLPIKVLTCLVQALIFCLLTCVYLSLVTHHDHGDEHDHGHGELAPAH
jgi:F-type H+-transporting ATPase subunit a